MYHRCDNSIDDWNRNKKIVVTKYRILYSSCFIDDHPFEPIVSLVMMVRMVEPPAHDLTLVSSSSLLLLYLDFESHVAMEPFAFDAATTVVMMIPSFDDDVVVWMH